MKIELEESEYMFLVNLLNYKLKAIKKDLSDIEMDINRASIDMRFQKQEFIAYRNRLNGLIKNIRQQTKSQQ